MILMRRLRKKQVLVVIVVSAVIIYLLYHLPVDSQYLEEEADLPEEHRNQDFLGFDPPEHHTQLPKRRPIAELIAQIHVKELPPIVVREGQSEEEAEDNFFRFLENKEVSCNSDQRLGDPRDGGANICMSTPMGFGNDCLVYSFGIGITWKFEDAVANIYGCEVMAFDPSLPIPEEDRGDLVHYYKMGLGPDSQSGAAGWKTKPFLAHLKERGHTERVIDYLKFDLEYGEWSVLNSFFIDSSLQNVKQLGFEIHSQEMFKSSRLGNPVRGRDFVKMYSKLKNLEVLGFKKFNYRRKPSGNYKSLLTKKMRSCCYELYYVNMNFIKNNETVVHHEDAERFH